MRVKGELSTKNASSASNTSTGVSPYITTLPIHQIPQARISIILVFGTVEGPETHHKEMRLGAHGKCF